MGPPMGLPAGVLPGPKVPMVPQRPPARIPPGAPMIPEMNFPPQYQMDSAPEDGPRSVACQSRAEVIKVAQVYPCPDTRQYIHRGYARFQERQIAQPSHHSDICGWVMASAHLDDHANANAMDSEIMHLRHNDFRLVFQCISGWCLMIWRSQEDFEEGIYGARRAPRALAWWDLRKAWDVQVDVGDPEADAMPYRVVIMTSQGNLYFLVELPDTVPVWYHSIRSLIKENALHDIQARDSIEHQRKRWPAACGLGRAMLGGQGVGERGLAIAFHAFDIDLNCFLQVGEIMLLIRELSAGILAAEGRAEGQDRETALYCARTRMPEDELFERAMRFRRRCDTVGDGKIRKEDFVRSGLGAMLEAVDVPDIVGFDDFDGSGFFFD